MRKIISVSGGLIVRRGVAFVLPFLAVILLLAAAPGHAQSLSGIGALSDLAQQRLNGNGNSLYDPDNQQDIIIQPAVPPVRQAPLKPSRLEQILSARAGVKLQQFGYEELGRGRAVIVPQTGAVQDDYVLGPGDQIVVSLRGQENGEFRVNVDRNGQVVLPRLAPIAASGRSFGSFRQDLEAAVGRAYVATTASISVGRMRQISVLVSGEVNEPGQRLLTGLSSAVDAILLSGGIKKSGSLRNVHILRGGHEYNVDLYAVVAGSGSAQGLRLADGDRIVVPPLGRTAAVAGLVRRPGIFELPPGASSISVRALLALAGGQEVRGRYRMSVLRILPDGRSEMAALNGDNGVVRDSEILSVQLGADQTTSQATLSGGSGLAGNYPIVTGTRLSDVLKAPGALGPSPYTPFGIIVRKDPVTLMRRLVAFSPVAVLKGKEDQTLQSDDVIRVLSTNEVGLLNFVVRGYLQALSQDQESIRNPLSQSTDKASDNLTLTKTLQSQAGQGVLLDDISSVPANIQRQEIIALLDTPAPGSRLARLMAARERADGVREARQDARLGNGGTNALPGSDQQTGTGTGANGALAAGGIYGATRPYNRQGTTVPPQVGDQAGSQLGGMGPYLPQSDEDRQYSADSRDRTDDLDYLTTRGSTARNFASAASDNDGFASNREVETFGQLSRQLGSDPLVLVNFLIDHRARLDGAVRGPGYYFVGPNVTLSDLVEAAGGTVEWADESGVELITTALDRGTGRALTRRQTLPLRQGMLANYIVRPRDQLRFGQVFTDVGIGSVTVQGQVRYAGTFPILRGEHLSDLLARAGGLTSTAYPYGTVFLRQSAAQLEREGYVRAANEVQNQLVIAMTRIGTDKVSPDTFSSMQTFVSELRNQKALGRISIVADPSVLAANPNLDPLLEPGDVIYVPQRPSTVSVLGQVLQPGSYPYRAGESLGDYIARAGGYSSTADESQTFIVLPDGSARKVEKSWLGFGSENLPPGSAIVVPRDVTPLDLRQTIIDVSQIFSQFAVAIASVAVLSKQ